MGAVGDIGATSFDAYEGIRIVIPGAVAVGVAAAVERTVFAGKPVLGADTGTAIVLALAVGLFLSFVDLPSRSAGYLLPSQPSKYVEKLYGRGTPNGLSPRAALTRYFLLFNTEMPALIRNRALYLGSMYRIAFETIGLSVLGSYLVMATAVTRHGVAATPPYWRTACWIVLSSFAAALVLAWVVAVTSARKRAEREATQKNPARAVLVGLRTLVVPHLAVYGVGLALLVFCPVHLDWSRVDFTLGEAWRVAGAVVIAAYWLIRYTAGDPVEDTVDAAARTRMSVWRLVATYTVGKTGGDVPMRRERASIDPLGAALLLATPLVVTWWRLLEAKSVGVPEPAALLGWAVVQLSAFTLVASRGHERRQHGAYASQTDWIDLNRSICDVFFDPAGGPEALAWARGGGGAGAAAGTTSPS